jgi:pimeloyl-ACP methyl ester carboxylesterase
MDSVTSRDGTTIAFERSGEGAAVILVGGALSTREAAAPLTAALAPRLTVLAFDRRGRGDSGDTPPYAVDREVDDLAALVAEVGGSAALFGMSSGAALSLEAALRGLPVTALALYEPPYLVDPAHPPMADDYRQRLQAEVDAGRRGPAVELFMREAVMLPEPALAAMRDSPAWPALESVAHTLPYDQAIVDQTPLDRPDPLRRFAPIAIPTLTMSGGASPDWLTAAARQLAEILLNGRHVRLAGQTHAVEPAVLAPILIEFLTEAT